MIKYHKFDRMKITKDEEDFIMQKISLKNVQDGMIVARNIYDSEGQKLLSVGTILNSQYIRRLLQLSIPAIYVKFNDDDDDIDCPDDIISEETRVSAIKNLSTAFRKCQATSNVDMPLFEATTKNLVDALLSNRSNVIQMNDIRCYDDYTFAHSVNVSILSAMLAMFRDYTPKRLHEVTLGALLHDIGKIKIPKPILNKIGSLTAEEFAIVRKHSEDGFNILRKCRDMSIVPMHVAFQHHEKYDGTGYPRGLKGAEIHEYARIVAIADVYDALTADRPYRIACLPYEAYRIMIQYANKQFDNELLETFFSYIAVFPVGCTVQLNTGEYGIVTDVEQNYTFTPKIKLLTTADNKLCQGNIILDLKKEKSYVSRSLRETELLELHQQIKSGLLK